jgi:hypothetical protein
MFDWIPLPFYSDVYFHIIFIVLLFIFIHSQLHNLGDRTLYILNFVGWLLFIFVLFYMGTRPISGRYFVDMATYNRIYIDYQNGYPINNNDFLFHYFMKFCGQFFNSQQFFFICSVLYIIPHVIIAKKWFKEYWMYAFLLAIGSFSFWAYGVNGIRNGLATAFFILAISSEKRVFQILWLLISVNIHAAMYLPAFGWIITWFYNKPKGFYYFWLATIPLSLTLPGVWENLFASLVEDDRASYLTPNEYDKAITQTGFRWDFLVYSAMGVGAGAYYLFKKKLEDPLYIRLYNTFLFANAFWILVIRANFSNRFAYLSWFLMAFVIAYPWLKYEFENRQHQKLGWILIAYISFTYFMNVIL